MDMIGLNSQFDDAPSILVNNLSNDLFQTIMNWPYQNFSASFGTPDDLVDDQVNSVLLMNIVVCHVESILRRYARCHHFSPNPSRHQKEEPFIPHFKDGGFLARFCNICS